MTKVAICFSDDKINAAFADLLRARGVQAFIIDSPEELDSETKIITEPIYFPDIKFCERSNCLVVGRKENLDGINAISLEQPLSEAKIEHALRELLKYS